jgi:CRP/FNR family cyclic AMP-dependent transcriptional regulator
MKVKATKRKRAFDPKVFLSIINGGRTIAAYRKNQTIYRQGDLADSVFYIQTGKAKVSVISAQGKEAVISFLGEGDFFGEGCMDGQVLRLATVAALAPCSIMRIPKSEIVSVIHEQPAFAELFIAHLLARNSRAEEDLVDQLFNSSEKRLARTLLILEFRQGRPGRSCAGQDQPGDTRRDDRHDALACQCVHEQVSATGAH